MLLAFLPYLRDTTADYKVNIHVSAIMVRIGCLEIALNGEAFRQYPQLFSDWLLDLKNIVLLFEEANLIRASAIRLSWGILPHQGLCHLLTACHRVGLKGYGSHAKEEVLKFIICCSPSSSFSHFCAREYVRTVCQLVLFIKGPVTIGCNLSAINWQGHNVTGVCACPYNLQLPAQALSEVLVLVSVIESSFADFNMLSDHKLDNES